MKQAVLIYHAGVIDNFEDIIEKRWVKAAEMHIVGQHSSNIQRIVHFVIEAPKFVHLYKDIL